MYLWITCNILLWHSRAIVWRWSRCWLIDKYFRVTDIPFFLQLNSSNLSQISLKLRYCIIFELYIVRKKFVLWRYFCRTIKNLLQNFKVLFKRWFLLKLNYQNKFKKLYFNMQTSHEIWVLHAWVKVGLFKFTKLIFLILI